MYTAPHEIYTYSHTPSLHDALPIYNAAATPISPEVLLQRARDMVPVLASRAKKAEELRMVPAETVQEMQEAGFFRVLQPKRYGGYEMDPQVFYDVCMKLAEGDRKSTRLNSSP